MRRSRRISLLAVLCVSALSILPFATGAELGGRDFIVDGLSLGQAIYPESSTYKGYTCRLSHDFAGYTWCEYQNNRSGKFVIYKSSVMLLHSSSNRLVFITEAIAPAYFAPGDVDREIARISKGFNQSARTMSADAKPGLPHAILAAWGDVTLTPLDQAALDALRRGDVIHRGLIADFIGDARESARKGLPVFSLGGGLGFLWGASFNDDGKGTLRDSAVDASELSGAEAPTAIISTPPPLKSPILSEYAPTLVINNKSCRDIDTVSIDGATQLHGIGPGDVGTFHMDGRCNHVVNGASGNVTWNDTVRCQGIPYNNYSINWIDNSGPPVDSTLPEDSLIVETRSNDMYGQIEITSKLDCVTIQKLMANRGNCKTGGNEPQGVLKFGQTVTIPYFCSKLLELNISTDQGSSVFTFDK
jgi:hypothetical protein